MPPAIAQRIHAEVALALTQPPMQERLAQNRIAPGSKTQLEFTQWLKSQMGTLVAAMNLTVN